jgi:hypothetical protein
VTDQLFREIVETFAVGRDATGSPLCKAVADMSRDEQFSALSIAAAAFDDAKEELAPFEPLMAASYMPETLDMGLTILGAIFRF